MLKYIKKKTSSNLIIFLLLLLVFCFVLFDSLTFIPSKLREIWNIYECNEKNKKNFEIIIN